MELEKLEIKEWLSLNAKLQQKKNALRKALKEKGVMKKDKQNDFDHYGYFSEAGYKQLFTELFANCGLELTTNELNYEFYQTTSDKMPNGRRVTLEFRLSDIETGFYETSIFSGEAMDKGDKAGYKADTGAFKYYLANTFAVATGDDPEQDSPQTEVKSGRPATDAQIQLLKKLGIEVKDGITLQQASELIKEAKNARAN